MCALAASTGRPSTAAWAAAVLLPAALARAPAADAMSPCSGAACCSLNGAFSDGVCHCDAGWRGPTCAELDVLPAQPGAHGLGDRARPTWGGSAVFEAGRWHLIVGSRAVPFANNSLDDYPCDSKIVRAVSEGADPAGPYEIVETLFPRSSWEPSVARNPATGALVLMFFGNVSAPPPAGSAACSMRRADRSLEYNLSTENTYITQSASGSAAGPWSAPQLVKGMEDRAGRPGSSPYSWHCASGNPGPAYHPNGTLFAAMRQNPCWKGFQTREHIGLWRADGGWDGEWTLVSTEAPLYGWGGGNQSHCLDQDGCPAHEDPHLFIDGRGGWHLLTHMQNNHRIHSDRGAYGWSLDGLSWTLETGPLMSNASAWPMAQAFAPAENNNNKPTSLLSTSLPLARRQRPSLIRDPTTGQPTHLLNGADFNKHPVPGQPNFCQGCHWGTGMTLIVPLGGEGGNR